MPTVADLDAFWRDADIGAAIERIYRPAVAPKAPCPERPYQRPSRSQCTKERIERILAQPPGRYPVAQAIAASVVSRLRIQHPDALWETERNRCEGGKRVCDIYVTVGGAR